MCAARTAGSAENGNDTGGVLGELVFENSGSAAAQLKRAFADLSNKSRVLEPDLVKAMDKYEAVLEPQEIHHLQAQARGAATLKPGDGTQTGDALAKGSNALSKLSLAWGKVFGMAEQINRKSTFIAAYRVAKAQKMADPGAFAKRAVDETQFVYSKANKMRFGRGAAGGASGIPWHFLAVIHNLESGLPESFNVLVKELQALGNSVTLGA